MTTAQLRKANFANYFNSQRDCVTKDPNMLPLGIHYISNGKRKK